MPDGAPDRGGEREALRRARRAVAKATHPDHGGDPETHRKAMEALDAQASRAPGTADRIRRRLRDVTGLPRTMREAYREGRDEEDS